MEGQNIGQHYRRKVILREKYGCNKMTETYEDRKEKEKCGRKQRMTGIFFCGAACGRSPAEIVGSNPTGGMDICLL